MVCDYEYNDDENKIVVDCSDCIYGSSVADYEQCMQRTIDMIMEVKAVESIVFRSEREYEYPYEQTKLLSEIAQTIEWILREGGLKKIESMDVPQCRDFLQSKYSEIQRLATNILRKDPIGGYLQLRRKIRHLNVQIKNGEEDNTCQKIYLNKILIPMKEELEKTEMIDHVKENLSGYHPGDRKIYRDMFHPSVRPNFMRTKYMNQPPEGGEIVDHYETENIDVEIYDLPDETVPIYHVTPPEFELDKEEYTILDAARRYISEHRPEASEFAEREKTRRVFSSISRDLITDLADKRNVNLDSETRELLTSVLTRYTAGFGILEVLLFDENIQDIYINAPIGKKPIFINHAKYGECKTNLIPTQDDAEAWATRFRLMSGRPLDEANPVLDTSVEVPGGNARVTIITRTLSPNGLAFALRRHRKDPWTYPLYLKPDINYFTPLFAGFMGFLLDGGRSFLIGGGRGSGKSSLLGATLLEMMKKWRVLTCEDTLELPVERMRELGYDIGRLKSRSVITQVETELPAPEAIRTALRLGDSALIIGEVRSKEAQALYEAMRIGAMAKTVAGTIHGESAYGLFDRVVNDLDVPPTSFKATDIVIICNRIKSAGGLSEKRRVTQVTEVRKHWSENPRKEDGFVNLMEYSAKDDELKPTDTLLNGESEILNKISSQVQEWSGRWDRVWDNIQLRGRVKKAIKDYALKTGNDWMMEAPFVTKSNSRFRLIMEDLRKEYGTIPSDKAFDEWEEWLKKQIKESQ
ncbi:MAG: ATPase, T2SS/T4P/T4SS family [Candidatus Aenigmatarchaeota archaeon]